MDRKEFRALIEEALTGASWHELAKVMQTYDLSKLMHRPQKRDTGERYFEHPRGVAVILIDVGLVDHRPATAEELQLAFLHDVREDCYPPQGMLEELYGQAFCDKLDLLSKEDLLYEASGHIRKRKKNLGAYWKGIKDGPREVRRVKLADRLHNLRSLAGLNQERQRKQVKKTREDIMGFAYDTDISIAVMLNSQMTVLEASWQ